LNSLFQVLGGRLEAVEVDAAEARGLRAALEVAQQDAAALRNAAARPVHLIETSLAVEETSLAVADSRAAVTEAPVAELASTCTTHAVDTDGASARAEGLDPATEVHGDTTLDGKTLRQEEVAAGNEETMPHLPSISSASSAASDARDRAVEGLVTCCDLGDLVDRPRANSHGERLFDSNAEEALSALSTASEDCQRLQVGPVHPSFRALSGRLKLTVRRHKFNQSFSLAGGVAERRRGVERAPPTAGGGGA